MKNEDAASTLARDVLRAQRFSAEAPGTIVRDVETLIEFIGERGLVTKSRQGNLPADVLPGLNQRITPEVELGLARPLLKDHPNIAGVFVLLRVMALARLEGKRLSIDPATLAVWRSLNDTEKYFALLEAWLYRAEAGVLGEGGRRFRSAFTANLRFLAHLRTDRWTSFPEQWHTYEFYGSISTWEAQLQARFGLIEMQAWAVRRASPEDYELARPPTGRGWSLAKARRTAWGEALIAEILAALAEAQADRGHDDREPRSEILGKEADAILIWWNESERPGFGFLQPRLQALFPAWQNVFQLPVGQQPSGVFVFKVVMSGWRARAGVWRRLAVPGETTLDEVADAVLDAFGFDDREHLYEFSYRDRMGLSRACYHPYDEEEPCAEEVRVDRMDLPANGVVTFRFDYGDDWRFELRLERIESAAEKPTGEKTARIELRGSAGEAPRQYPDWSDGEDIT